MHFQVWDMGTAQLFTNQSEAWEAIDPEGCYNNDVYKGLRRMWEEFHMLGAVGDIYRLNQSVYVVKLGKDWA
jgi:hypothetical protein